MKFLIVRGKSLPVDFTTGLLTGLADDGGLYVPESIPTLPPDWRQSDSGQLADLGEAVLTPYIDAISPRVLRDILTTAWDFPIPLSALDDNIYLLELLVALLQAWFNVGIAVSAFALGELAEVAGYPAVFIVAGTFSAAALLAVCLRGRETDQALLREGGNE